MTKKERRRLAKKPTPNTSLKLNSIKPLTKNQQIVFDEYYHDQNLFLHGVAGSGKTYLALFLALQTVLGGLANQNKVIIVRSAVPSRDIGFLPGSLKEKEKVYEAPYADITSDLFSRGDAYSVLKGSALVEFMSTSFIRGITLRDSIVILDEIQNYDFPEAYSVLTRIGRGCRVIICGDFRQSDLDRSGIRKLMSVIRHMSSFSMVEFGVNDIVRSGFVKEFLIATMMDDQSVNAEELKKKLTYNPETGLFI